MKSCNAQIETDFPLTVMKFGGASLSTPAGFRRAASRIASRVLKAERIIVVVSAMGDETDRLLGFAEEVSGRTQHSEIDAVLAAGEQVSAGLMALALEAEGIRARSFLAYQLPIQARGESGNADIVHIELSAITAAIDAGVTPVIAGFQAVNEHNRIVTLGRGGSDTTAVALTAALKADVCELYKDVSGVYSSDPRTDIAAKKYSSLIYEDMALMTFQGAQILHHKAVMLAAQFGVTLHVRSAFTDDEGTYIGKPMSPLSNPNLKEVRL